MSPAGTHGLHCRRSAGRHSRHGEVNDVVARTLCTAQLPAKREPIGLYTTQTRPDGQTLVPWRLGRCLVWDATVVDTLAPSHLAVTSLAAGAAADEAESAKRAKYVDRLPPAYEFVPLGFETLGGLGASAKEFLGDLTKRLVHVTGDLRAGEYFCQRLSLALLRGNVGSILGSVAQASRDSVLSIGVALGEVGVLGEVPRRERVVLE